MLFEVVVAFFKIAPKRVPAAVAFFGEAGVSHSKGKDVHAEVCLTVGESFFAEGVYFLDRWIRHGKATDGDTVAVNHDE